MDGGLVQQPNTEATLVAQGINITTTAAGRLFIRNLPYTATDYDIRRHFEQLGCGQLEEVITTVSLSIIQAIVLHMVYDEHPDRDNLCIHACDVTQEQYFSRCCFFPETLRSRHI